MSQLFKTQTKSITESTTISEMGNIIYFCTNAADTADITHTLPAAATAGAGAEFTFIKTDSTTYDIIIDGNGSETIGGNTTVTLDCQNARIKIVSDGSNWQILEGGIVSDSEIGLIQDFAGSNLPTGFLWCDGQAVSRTTYADLYAKIGTRFGVGDGSTTFNVPFDTTLKQYSLSFDANPSGWSSIRSYGVPYKVYDESGNEVWHLKGTIVGEYTSAATGTFTISGVTFKNATDFKEPVIVDGGNKTGQGRTVANSGSIDFWFDTAGDAVRIDFDAELESKPTFVDDNSTSDYQITKIIRYAPKVVIIL